MAEFDDFTIDDRIAGLKDDLIMVDKERAEQMTRQRFDININTNDEFFNLQQEEFAFPSPRSSPIKIEHKNEPIWSSNVNEKKKKALETLEKLSNELENDFKEDDKLKISENFFKRERRKRKRTQTIENEKEEKKESNTDVRSLVFILTIIFGVYVTIGLGKAYLKNL